jgi:membrane dipeptidase
MEKAGDLPTIEQHAPTQRRSSRRRLCNIDDVVFFIVLFLIASTIWFSEIRALFPGQKHTCGEQLTVEKRAVKILQENPLIGQPYEYEIWGKTLTA